MVIPAITIHPALHMIRMQENAYLVKYFHPHLKNQILIDL